MTEHQGLPVPGYLPQSPAAVTLNKQLEERMLRQLDVLSATPGVDPRWLAIGRTQLEQAWMAINRAVFKPSRIDLPEDSEPAAPAG